MIHFRIMRMFASVLVLAFLAVFSRTAIAEYPEKTIRIIAPAPPGGGTDFLSRLIGKNLAERWGQTVVVDNVPGASGTIGSRQAQNARADGYTLLMSYQGTHAIAPALLKDFPFDPVNDFRPITQVVSQPFVLVVHPSIPARTMQEFVEYVHKNPGKLNFGSAGAGSGGHLVGELFNLVTNSNAVHVPYQGSAPMTTDLLAGHVQFAFDTVGTTGPHIRSGALRALAVTNDKRLTTLPDIPTVVEEGYPKLVRTGWYGLFAPKDTSPDIVIKIQKEVARILQKPDVEQALITGGYTPKASASPEEFRNFVRLENKDWGELVKSSGAQVK